MESNLISMNSTKSNKTSLVIQRLRNTSKNFFDLEYFLDVAENYSHQSHIEKNHSKSIAVLGLSIPEEIIYSLGGNPVWILGGSFEYADFADKYVPRDTDPVSKSLLGEVLSNLESFKKNNTLLIVPITNDSSRKIAQMLSKEIEVFPVDVPPNKKESFSYEKWLFQMQNMTKAIEKKTRKPLTISNLKNSVETVNSAKHEMKRLLFYSMKDPSSMPGSLCSFIINTYYFSSNIIEWTIKLNHLNKQLSSKHGSSRKHSSYSFHPTTISENIPNVLIAGSPILFPNFKVPFLLEEINVNIPFIISQMSKRIYSITDIKEDKKSLSELFEKVVSTFYLVDNSPCYTNFDSQVNFVDVITKEVPIHGVIYHVLKGHISYDFELDIFEEYFKSKNISFFRLETDYNYQDIEQLRIRSEAFIEMIQVKYFRMRA